MNARQMLTGMPVHMADGGSVTDEQIRNWFVQNQGATDAQIAAAMDRNGVSTTQLASAMGYNPEVVAQRYAAVTAPAATPAAAPVITTAAVSAAPTPTTAAQDMASQTITSQQPWTPDASAGLLRARQSGLGDQQYYGSVALAANKWLANPGTAAEAFDAMVKSGISVSDLLNAGISQGTIDKAYTIPTDAAQQQVNTTALNSMTSMLAQNPLIASAIDQRGIQDLYAGAKNYVAKLQQDGLTDAERNQLREAATAQGWGYADIRAAGIDPMILFQVKKEEEKPKTPITPITPITPVPPVPQGPQTPFPYTPYTPVTVYQPLPGGKDLFQPGEPALDMEFRNSPVRTVSPVTGQYMYTPAAKLRPATGAGWSWTPPVVTSRPRQLLDVGPTASASQLYAQSRSAQDRALRNAFASQNLPMSGANTYYWQSRLRGGDYSPGGTFDPAAFQTDFNAWSANLPATGGGSPIASTVNQLQPQMFLNMQPQMFAKGGEVTASRKMLEQIEPGEYVTKKAEGGPVEVPPEVPSRSTSADQYEDVFKDIPLLSRVGEYVGGAMNRAKYGLRETGDHVLYNNALKGRFRELYPELKADTQDNGLLDAAVKYAGAYDWAVRPEVAPEDARSMAHAYQLYDYNRSNRNPQDEVSDYVRNMAGVEEGIKHRAEGRRLSDEELFRAALDYAVSQTGGTMPLGKVDLWLREARKGITPAVEEQPVKKKDGGDVRAQLDRIGSAPNAKTPEPRPTKEQTESATMLDRLKQAGSTLNEEFYRNITQPFVGTLVDATVGLGDLGQMGVRYLGNRAGLDAGEFVPVAAPLKEDIGVAGYDPYTVGGVAANILPFARGEQVAGTAANTLAKLFPNLGRETAGYVGSELGAAAAREVAPDSTAAELLASVAGGSLASTAQGLRSPDLDPTISRMAQYTGAPKPEQPFVGRLDRYVAENITSPLTKDQFLGQITGKFREYDILRAKRALKDVARNEKLTPDVLLEKLGNTYDPADFRTTIEKMTELPYMYMDNPWAYVPTGTTSLSRNPTNRGVIYLTRGGEQGIGTTLTPDRYQSVMETVKQFENTQTTDEVLSPLDYVYYDPSFASLQLEELSQALKEINPSSNYGIPSVLETMERTRDLKNNYIGRVGAANLQEQASGYFPKAYAEVVKRGGIPAEQMPARAFDLAAKQVYGDNIFLLGKAYEKFFPNRSLKEIVDMFPPFDEVVGPPPNSSVIEPNRYFPLERIVQDTINSKLLPAVNEDFRQKIKPQLDVVQNNLGNIREKLESAFKVGSMAGSNPGYAGQHTLGDTKALNQIAFSRFSGVTTQLPGETDTATGIYLHEMQSDLLDDIRTKGKRGEGLAELEDRVKAADMEAMRLQEKVQELSDENDQISSDMRRVRTEEQEGRLTREESSTASLELREKYNSNIDQLDRLNKRVTAANEKTYRIRTARENARRGVLPNLDEAFAGMETNPKGLQQLMMRNAVAAAVEKGDRFVAFPSQEFSAQPQLYERVPQNARDVVKDLGEGFEAKQLTLQGSRGPFTATAIVWGDNSATGRESVQRILNRGIPFAEGGEVTTDAEAVKKLLSYLNK